MPFFKNPDGTPRLASDLTEVQMKMWSWLGYIDWVLGPDGPSDKPDEETLRDPEGLEYFIQKWKADMKNENQSSNTKRFEIG